VTSRLVDEAEIVVVGAGPAGAACALRLASAGHDVLLVDQSAFPRDKPCGDGLTRSALTELSLLGFDDLIASRPAIEGLRIMSGSGSPEYRPYNTRMTARCIPRALLDERLLTSALHVGARFRQARVDRVMPDERHPCVALADSGRSDQPTIRAKLVIAADGATSRVARELGWPRQGNSPTAYAVRAYFESDCELEPVFDIYLPLKLGNRRFPGYGWVFPVEPLVANIGVGYWRGGTVGAPPRIREALNCFVQQLQQMTARHLGAFEIRSPLFGSPLGVQFDVDRCEADGVLMVGDAARTTDPATGEGIAYALRGARVVADIAMRRRRGVASRQRVGHALAQRFPSVLQDVALPLRIMEHRYNGVSADRRATRKYPFVRTMRGVLTAPEMVPPLTASTAGRALSARGCDAWLDAVDAYLMDSVGTSFPVATQLLSSKLRFGVGPTLSLALWSTAHPLHADCTLHDCAATLELIRVGISLTRDTIDRTIGDGARANNAMCILIGDFAFSRAIHHASAVGPKFARLVGSTIQQICDAHFAEAMTFFQRSRDASDVLRAAARQSSLLLRLAVQAGGTNMAAGPTTLARYARFADELGVALRLAEDLAALLVGDNATGQLAGADLALGAYPTAVLWAASRDPDLHDMLYTGGPPLDIASIIERTVRCAGVSHAMEEVERHAEAAKRTLEEGDPAALADLADAVIHHARDAAQTMD
jgi:geranylgeranyl reductase family protein